MQKLSILHTEASPGWGGQMIRILTELEGFRARGHDVALVAQPTGEIFKRAAEREIPVEAVAMNRPDVPRAIWQAMRIIRQRRVDIVHTHTSRDSWIGGVAARLSRRKPIVIQMQYYAFPTKKGFVNRLMSQKLSDCVITTGETLRKQLVAEGYYPSDRIVSVPPGVDLTRFDPGRYDPEMIRNELGYTNGPLIAMTGAITNGNGLQNFIAAAAEVLNVIPGTRFYIVGDGLSADVRHVREVIAHYNLQNEIFMLGYREDMPQILSGVDLIIHCASENSGLSQIVLQALAMGKPVVAAKVGAIPEAVFDGISGYLVPPRDIRAVSDRVTDLLQDDLKRKAFGQAGRRLVKERYSLEGMLNRIEQLYEKLLATRNDHEPK